MKIISLQAENIKGIKAVFIKPQENTVVISGGNGQGKSSVLDAIFWALAGTKNMDKKPIREGMDQAFICIDLGEYIVERRMTTKNNTLTVKTAEGANFTNPQTILDGMLGSISFDPLEFTKLDSKKQLKTLKELLKLDFSEIENKYKDVYDDRTFINREISILEAQLGGLQFFADTPAHIIDVKEKSDAFVKASEQRSSAEFAYKTLKTIDSELETLKKQLEDAEKRRLEQSKQVDELKKGIVTVEQLVAMENEIANAESINERIRTNKTYTEKQAALKEKVQLGKQHSDQLEKLTLQKTTLIANAKMPIEGLTLQGECVIFKGIPLAQCSSAEQLKISTAIAMALNPKIRVIRIKDGALLDMQNLDWIKNLADTEDYQIWIERVGNEPMSIVMVDGSVQE